MKFCRIWVYRIINSYKYSGYNIWVSQSLTIMSSYNPHQSSKQEPFYSIVTQLGCMILPNKNIKNDIRHKNIKKDIFQKILRKITYAIKYHKVGHFIIFFRGNKIYNHNSCTCNVTWNFQIRGSTHCTQLTYIKSESVIQQQSRKKV